MLTELLERSAAITSGYRLHGVTSFPIRRAKFHASTVLIRRTTA
jgi:hypothetical protein